MAAAQRRAELVACAESIPAGCPEQHPGDAIGLRRRQLGVHGRITITIVSFYHY
jgi:hypothetical protein